MVFQDGSKAYVQDGIHLIKLHLTIWLFIFSRGAAVRTSKTYIVAILCLIVAV